MNENNNLFSRTVIWLRFPLTALVVLLHTPIVVGDETTKDLNSLGWVLELKTFFSEGLCRVAVPAFFFISGYYFYKSFDKWNINIWFEKINKRIRTLLVPYILWNLISLLFAIMASGLISGGGIFQFMNDHGWLRIFWDNNRYNYTSSINILGIEMFNSKPLNFPLWYIRDLLVMVIISPVVRVIITYSREYGLIVMALMMILNIGIPVEGFSMTSIFFFSLGGYFMLYKKDIICEFRRFEMTVLIISIVLLLIMVFEFGKNDLFWGISHNSFKLFGLITLFNIAGRIVQGGKAFSKENHFLTASCFFVFACHALIVARCGKVLNILLNSNRLINLSTQYFLTFLLTIFICLFLYYIFYKALPKITNILTGGR